MACRSLRLLGAVQKGLFLSSCIKVQYRHAKTSMILACWRPQWRPRGPKVEVAMCGEVVYPGELPVGLSMLLLCGPRLLSAAHWRPSVESPCMCSPSSPWPPSEGSSMQ